MMVFLAYAMFIVMLALPFIVIGGIAIGFLAGVANLAIGIARRKTVRAIVGAALVAVCGGSGLAIYYWATTPPSNGDTASMHSTVYRSRQAIQARYTAMKWLRDGTFERLAEEQRNQAEAPPDAAEGGKQSSGEKPR
jgi:hypothetical protein